MVPEEEVAKEVRAEDIVRIGVIGPDEIGDFAEDVFNKGSS